MEEAGQNRPQVHLQHSTDHGALGILISLDALGDRNAFQVGVGRGKGGEGKG